MTVARLEASIENVDNGFIVRTATYYPEDSKNEAKKTREVAVFTTFGEVSVYLMEKYAELG